MSIKKVGIIGMGALGSLYGSQIKKNATNIDLFFLMDKERIKRAKPIIFNGEEQKFNLTNDKSCKMDFIIFAVKGSSLQDAITLSKNFTHEKTIFLSVMNGVISEEIIMKSYNYKQVIHAVARGMDTTKIGNEVKSVNFGKIHLGITHSNNEVLDDVLDLLRKSKIQYEIEKNIMRRIWSKWVLNVGVNQAVTYFNSTYGIVQKADKERDFMINLMLEAMNLANLEGIDINKEDISQNLKLIDSLDSDSMPSMRQDSYMKKKTEVMLFSGTAIELAKKYKVKVPYNQEAYNKITEMELNY